MTEDKITRRANLLGHYHRLTEEVQGRRPLHGALTRSDVVAQLQEIQRRLNICDNPNGHHWVPGHKRRDGTLTTGYTTHGENSHAQMVCTHCLVPQSMNITGEWSYQ